MVDGNVIVVTTQCRNCSKVGAVKLYWPPVKANFPRECEACGQRRVGPAPAGLMDSMHASFEAGIAQQKATLLAPVV